MERRKAVATLRQAILSVSGRYRVSRRERDRPPEIIRIGERSTRCRDNAGIFGPLDAPLFLSIPTPFVVSGMRDSANGSRGDFERARANNHLWRTGKSPRPIDSTDFPEIDG